MEIISTSSGIGCFKSENMLIYLKHVKLVTSDGVFFCSAISKIHFCYPLFELDAATGSLSTKNKNLFATLLNATDSKVVCCPFQDIEECTYRDLIL